MNNSFPIYHLLSREITARIDVLLEMSQKKELSIEEDSKSILEQLHELHDFASKIRSDQSYHPLVELKKYLEYTMIPYQDESRRRLSMRLSEVISLLGTPEQTEVKFKPKIADSLMNHFLRHFRENLKPGHPLFLKLIAIKETCNPSSGS